MKHDHLAHVPAAMTPSGVALCSSESASAGGIVVRPYLKTSTLTATQSAILSSHPGARGTSTTVATAVKSIALLVGFRVALLITGMV